MPSEKPRPVLLLIHGTGAASDSDDGVGWWQRGSSFSQWLNALFQSELTLPPEMEVFHWSGANSETARRNAARSLASLLEGFEREGRPYHLVGHSHGGSVVWLALCELFGKPRHGNCLLSWTTVGTPFLHFAADPFHWSLLVPFLLAGLALRESISPGLTYLAHFKELLADSPEHALAIVLLSLSEFLVITLLVSSLYAVIASRRTATQPKVDGKQTSSSLRGISRGPLVAVVGLCVVAQFILGPWVLRAPWKHLDEVRRVGELLPVFVLPSLWCIPIITILIIAVHFARVSHARYQVARERKCQLAAYQRVGTKHLCLWSKADEAIGGLSTTLDAHADVVPRWTRDTLTPVSAIVFSLAWPLRWLYNGFVAGAADEFVWKRVTQHFQGNDFSCWNLESVTQEPAQVVRAPHLRSVIDEELIVGADKQAGVAVAGVRAALGLAALDGPRFPRLVTGVTKAFRNDQLVHTSYFDLNGVRAVIGEHVVRLDPNARNTPDSPRADWTVSTGLNQSYVAPSTKLITAALSLAAAIVTLLSWGSSVGIERTLVEPYTDSFQTDAIEREVTESTLGAMSTRQLLRWARSQILFGRLDSAKRAFDAVFADPARLAQGDFLSDELVGVVEAWVATGRPAEASNTTRLAFKALGPLSGQRDKAAWARRVLWLSPALVRLGQREEVQPSLREAIGYSFGRTMPETEFCELHGYAAAAGSGELQSLAAFVRSPSARKTCEGHGWAMCTVALVLAEGGYSGEALEALRIAGTGRGNSVCVNDLVVRLSQRDLRRARQLAASSISTLFAKGEDPWVTAQAVADMAQGFVRTGMNVFVVEQLRARFAAMGPAHSEYARSKVLLSYALAFLKLGSLQDAEAMLSLIVPSSPDADYEDRRKVAVAFACSGLVADALKIAEQGRQTKQARKLNVQIAQVVAHRDPQSIEYVLKVATGTPQEREGDPERQMNDLGLAQTYAALGKFRQARLLAEQYAVVDRVDVYSTILIDYANRRDSKLPLAPDVSPCDSR